ncbi:hypothetical protein AB0883_05085 [Micromonospora sp. NPDC047812]
METTTVTDYLADLDAPSREIGEKLRTLADVDPALSTDWLRQAHALEAR